MEEAKEGKEILNEHRNITTSERRKRVSTSAKESPDAKVQKTENERKEDGVHQCNAIVPKTENQLKEANALHCNTKVLKTESNTEEEALQCNICRESITTQLIGQPEHCQHKFCLTCLIEWSKRDNTCPLDRKVFNKILLPNAKEANVDEYVDIYVPVDDYADNGDSYYSEEDDDNYFDYIEAESEPESEDTESETEESREKDVVDKASNAQDAKCFVCQSTTGRTYKCFYCPHNFHRECVMLYATAVKPRYNGEVYCTRCNQD